MRNFVSLFRNLDSTSSVNRRTQALVQYFQKADHHDILWALALFIGKRPSRTISTSHMRIWAEEKSTLPSWLFKESYQVVGDLAEMIAITLPVSENTTEFTLSNIIEQIISLKGENEELKRSFVEEMWDCLDPQARFHFNKIITGSFRVGVDQKTIVKALSKYLNKEEAVVSYRLIGDWSPRDTTFEELLVQEDGFDLLSRPYPFNLSHALENNLNELEGPEKWSAEWKWDGLRCQVIKRKGTVFIWSKGEEMVSNRFPEILSLQHSVTSDDFVMDGEIVAFRDQKSLPFSSLQKRLNRKKVGKKLLQEVPIIFKAYDLIEYDGNDIRSMDLVGRRKRLATLLDEINIPEHFRFSEDIPFKAWEELYKTREKARSLGVRGIMLKNLESKYGVGRERGDWWSLNRDPFTIDAVLLYAMRENGRRSNLFSDFTFAVWDEGRLVPFAKAFSGLQDTELNQIAEYVNNNTIETFGPVRSVKPELVFELAFDGISRSKRHKSGVSVRFPRILRWRQDKLAQDANSLDDLMGLLDLYEDQ